MRTKSIQIVCAAAAAFMIGHIVRMPVSHPGPSSDRKPLYYVDPMHPAYKSDKPGIAPDCGMKLEPVYAGQDSTAAAGDTGAIRVSSDKQRLMGLNTSTVTRQAESRAVHAVGRVAAEDSRTEQVAALADGVVRTVSAVVPGSIVRKDELLASYFVYMRDVYTAIQAYFVAMSALDQRSELAAGRGGAMDNTRAQLRKEEELLKAYGITEPQIQELARTREITRDIEFRSPAAGVILTRNVYVGQKVDRGTELFRVADLSRVWVVADVYENDMRLLHPGTAASIRYNGRSWHSSLTDIRSIDPTTRTTKVRLEVSNEGLTLRPDTIVDVDFNTGPFESLSAPADAVLDTGRRQYVFVKTGAESFEPRAVTTGIRYADRIEIVTGLSDGDKILTSGLFLLDSEARLHETAEPEQPRAAAKAAKAEVDPVCGMDIEGDDDSKWESTYRQHTYHFCSRSCKENFDKNPDAFLPKATEGRTVAGRS